ncbi:uncharacterized protein DUF4232 [Streptomyces sp. 1114.5]|uniref:DUF4232 domain-containing protein n=1 Tax=Streptomyces sp. 1114.5 TaxID=1938830 RepID=UPI000EB34F0C|nr:DUF4232 domain-containing protein [Streptomyces sp. 1114.5]RKT20222.1 uncharacterized protein DUF4232 [Streptomyces sp. 1114.5]
MRQFEKPTRTLTARRPAPAAPAATAVAALAAVLLTGCGTQTAGTSGTSARAGAAGAPTASGSTGPCGAPQPAGPAQDGVRITAVGPACAEYEVTNPGAEPSDITVLFARTPDQASGPGNLSRTVTALAPGATEKGRLDLTAPGPGPATAKPGTAPQVKILKVRSVPSAEAPRPDGPCPPSGLRLYADQGDAAMGLRVVGLHLRNCGTTTVALDGYPTLQLLDQGHRPVDGVRLLSGGAEIATGTGADKPPQKIALRPGEGAGATLVWRNTTEAGTPVNVPYVRVRATPGAAPVMVTPELDLGTTGRLGIGAWAREDAAAQAPASRPPAAGG